MSKNELLAVLDMPEEEQQKQAILEILDEEIMEWFVDYDMHLADLAFRLWNKVLKHRGTEQLGRAMWYVYRRVKYNDHRFDFADSISETEKILAVSFFAYYPKPISRIVAALIAKEKERQTKINAPHRA